MRNKILLVLIILFILSISLFAKSHEIDYQKVFCKSKNGKMEVTLPIDNTRIDCVYDHYACEVDWGRHAYEAIGQTEYYSYMSGKKRCIVLIQSSKADNRYIGRLKPFCKDKGIKLYIINKKFEIKELVKGY